MGFLREDLMADGHHGPSSGVRRGKESVKAGKVVKPVKIRPVKKGRGK